MASERELSPREVQWKEANDHVRSFLRGAAADRPFVPWWALSKLYERYEAWCSREKVPPLSKPKFSNHVRATDIAVDRDQGRARGFAWTDKARTESEAVAFEAEKQAARVAIGGAYVNVQVAWLRHTSLVDAFRKRFGEEP